LPAERTAPAGKAAVRPPGLDATDDDWLYGERARSELLLIAILGGGALVIGTAAVATWDRLGAAVAVALLAGSAVALVLAARHLGAMAERVQRAAWQRRMLERHLGRYVSPNVAEVILSADGALAGAERRDVTVLFCDLRDFTTLCEREHPEEVVYLLNTFFERACEIVQAHGGTVNKFMGDGMLALFGAPTRHPSPVRAAVESAHEIMYACDELRARGGFWRQLDIGISLDTGDVVVGEVGASSRAEYTAIGTTVNRAARLQGVSREAERRIVLSEECARRLGPRANLVSIGAVKLKGLSRPVQVYAFRHS
jgi:adenylate cyclase